MRRLVRWFLAIITLVVLASWAITFFGPPGLVPRALGTGGFMPRVVNDVPHPFSFDRPRFWDDRTDELHRSGEAWDVQVLGPQTDVGVTFAALEITIRPGAPRAAEYPADLGGPYISLENFIDRQLPSGRNVVSEQAGLVGGKPARNLTYDYEFYGATTKYPRPRIDFRGRSAVFEDRGYYYSISYDTRDAEFDRYIEVFERAVKTFRFLDQ